MNKRGQGLSTNAIILIVLGVIVLVILAVGFMAGWDKIAPWIKKTNNVQEIAQACNIACSTNAKFDYCSFERTLDDGTIKILGNCLYFNSLENNKYGIVDCPGIIC